MKPLILVLLAAGFSIGGFGQSYSSLRDSAAVYREKGDYAKAFALLTQGIVASRGNPYHNDIYDAAALASLTGQTDTALYYLQWLERVGESGMVTGDAMSDCDFKAIRTSDKWWKLFGEAMKLNNNRTIRNNSSIAACLAHQDSLRHYVETRMSRIIESAKTETALYKRLQSFREYPNLRRQSPDDLQFFAVKINDSVYSFYTVQLPHQYSPDSAYAVLFDLHGGVYINSGFPTPFGEAEYGNQIKEGMNQFFSKYAYKNNVILVFPNANKDFNWMAPDDGFGMVPTIVRDMKRYFNVDDNRVFLSGHSNGATGVVSYLLKDPGYFAGFYGFNSNPRVQTGGTFIRNASDRSYFNVATDKDYYFPVSGHDTLNNIAHRLGIDWQNHVFHGFPHWFPQFPESEPAFQLMFADMKTRKRNPFPHELFWECDDTRHGRCDWLSINTLDTTAGKKDWQTEINFPVTHWINNRDTAKVSDTVISAFKFPRRSGAVRANYHSNIFTLETSRVRSISLYLSPDMIDFTKPVVVIANGKKIFEKTMMPDKDYLIQSFRTDFDRKAIWVNEIILDVE